MKFLRTICFIIISFLSLESRSQNLKYSWVDPCTGVKKNVMVPKDGITITYFGQIRSFSPNDFNNGEFINWTSDILSKYGSGNPCGSIIGISQALDISQSTAVDLITLINNISSLSEIQKTNSLNLMGGLESMKNGEGKKGKNKGINNDQNNGEQPISGGNEVDNNELENDLESNGSLNLVSGSINSIEKISDNGKPQVVISSDFSGFDFRGKERTFGGKATAGITSLNWDGSKSWGILTDWTSQIRGPNATGFYAIIKSRSVNLVSLTGTLSFIGKGSKYGTIGMGQMWSFPKIKGFKTIWMATFSYGDVYGENFKGTAFISGTTFDRRIHKRWDIKLMNLFIYAPYVSYYDDIVLKSPYVIMPVLGTNFLITPKFKFNINLGTTYAIKKDIMNFTIMFGTRIGI